MYKDSILKIENEIKQKEKTIKNIKNFSNLSIDEKIETIKCSGLRDLKDSIPDIIKADFKSALLRDGVAEIGLNHFTIKVDSFKFSIGLSYGNSVYVENTKKIEKVNDLKDKHIKCLADARSNLEKLNRYQENSNYKNFKSISDILRIKDNSYKKYILKFFKNKQSVEFKIYDESRHIDILEYILASNEERTQSNGKLNIANKNFLNEIDLDLKYFINNGYCITYDFEEKYF